MAPLKFIKNLILNPQGKQKNLGLAISPIQFARIKHDIKSWREAVVESELPFFPYRVKMQRIFQDTILNEHVIACMERRKDLTMLRDFAIVDDKGNESVELKQIFRNHNNSSSQNKRLWFDDFMSYCLDTLAFGYSLISLGDVVDGAYPDLTIVPRQNISPDRLNVSNITYNPSGDNFMEPPYVDWHIWLTTPSRLGKPACGYGYLYEVAKAEIYLRNNIAFNADYNEIYGQPIRKGITSKTDEAERGKFEKALANMASSPYIMLDVGQDDVQLIEAKGSGSTFSTYADFEKRNEQKISKVILGHADAVDSIPGKLGASQGNSSPAEQAITDKQLKDSIFIENVVNAYLIPRMRIHGFKIPLNYHFSFKNNAELEEIRGREDDSNTKTAQIFKTIADAGGDLTEESWIYFADRTGIPGIKPQVKSQPPLPSPVIQQPLIATPPKLPQDG